MDESDIPIDINSNKLLDWLISRRHVSKDWQENIITIREKINNAIQDMPAHKDIVELLSGQHINYFHCLRIIEILKETEADSKNMFGMYRSQRMKDWQDIVSSYQKNNLYLAECAQILMRNVSYEVPSLKKQIAKCETVQLDGEKKIKELTKAENTALNEFNADCKQLGIKGQNMKKELLNLVIEQLPELHNKQEANLRSLQPAVDLYKAFIKFHLGKETENDLPILTFIIQNGNTTTYEYTYGEKPIRVEEQTVSLPADTEVSTDIDFGDDVQIDFGELSLETPLEGDLTPAAEGEIDWGTPGTDEEFEIVDIEVTANESGIVVEKSGMDGGVAQGADALTLLDNPNTRNQILNDLKTLDAFFKMRLFEMSSNANLLMSQLDAPSILQMQSVEETAKLCGSVSIALEGFSNKRMQHLYNIKHSPQYIDILSGNLLQKLEIVSRMKDRKRAVEESIAESARVVNKTKPLIACVIDATKTLQNQLEEDISRKYKGRKVNIVGGVNLM